MFCNYCRTPNPDDALYCSSCGEKVKHSHRSRTPTSDQKPPLDLTLIRTTLIAQDENNRLWSTQDVVGTRAWLLKHHKKISTLGELNEKFGRGVVHAEIERIIQERQKYLAAIGKIMEIDTASTECHICGSTHKTVRRDFGLAEVLADEREWIETAVSIVISAIALPTLGIGAVRFPGRTRRFRFLTLHLILCHSCMQEKTTPLLWNTKLTAGDYALHPAWQLAQELGFTKILTHKDLSKLMNPH